jgi:GNAT superfamily N-acetyltransferase
LSEPHVRAATEADLPEVHALMRGLAEFEDLVDEFVVSVEDLGTWLFGDDPAASVSVAVADDGTIGAMALWYRTFSSFLGRPSIWLEDLFVKAELRGQHFAKALLEHLGALTQGSVEWEVLDWNRRAIDFYDSLGAKPVRGWTKYHWEPRGS